MTNCAMRMHVGKRPAINLRAFLHQRSMLSGQGKLGRVFGMIASDEFSSAFRRWVSMVVPCWLKTRLWRSMARQSAHG